jgi:TPR repeat protein
MSLAWLLDDKTEAAHWLNRAADQGDQTAQYNLAWAYIRGVGVAVDYQLARKWFTLAARQGSANAQNALGYILHHGGPGLQPDPVEASHWYRQALRQKHPLTPGNLADLANENPEIILDRARTLFAAPGSNTPHIARLKPGETVHALKQQDGWTAVILDDRRTMGWIKDAVTN